MDARVAPPSRLRVARQSGIVVARHGVNHFSKKRALPIFEWVEGEAGTLCPMGLLTQSGLPACQPVDTLGYIQALIRVHLRGPKLDEMCARTPRGRLAVVHVFTPAQEHGSQTVALHFLPPACPTVQLPGRQPASLGQWTFAFGSVSPRVGNQGRRRLNTRASSHVCRGVDELVRQRARLTAPTNASTLTRTWVEKREATPASVLACPQVHRGADKRARRPLCTRARLTAPTNAGTLTRTWKRMSARTSAGVRVCQLAGQ